MNTPKLTVPGYNQYGHFDRAATVPEVVAWLREQGVGEDVWRCESHKSQNHRPDLCEYADAIWQQYRNDITGECRMVKALVIPLDGSEST